MTIADMDWLKALGSFRKAHGGKATAEKIGYSAATISQVLSGNYKGDLNAVRQKVEGALMGATVECPLIGEIPRNRCLDFQRQGYAPTNPLRAQLLRACPTCPNRRGAE